MPRLRLALAGAGRAGSALGIALAARGWKISAIASSRTATARRLAQRLGRRGAAAITTTDLAQAASVADAVLVAVPDREIPGVVRALARTGPSRRTRIALHTSGAQDATALAELHRPLRAGRPALPKWAVGSLHPLMTFPPPGSEPPDLTGVTFAIDGDSAALRLARAIARSLGGRAIVLPGRRRADYHLAACFASNYVVALMAEAAGRLGRAGLGRNAALAALLPLLEGTAASLRERGLPAVLTGPVSRGDDATIARHVAALRTAPRDLRALHVALVRSTMRLARSSGRIDAAAVRRIERALRARR